MVRIIAEEFLTDERDRKYYADHYTCCPPPLFIIIITLVEVSVLYLHIKLLNSFPQYIVIKNSLRTFIVAGDLSSSQLQIIDNYCNSFLKYKKIQIIQLYRLN